MGWWIAGLRIAGITASAAGMSATAAPRAFLEHLGVVFPTRLLRSDCPGR